MPYALVIIGLIMIITGILNTYAQFGAQLQSDFTGPKSFIVWIIAIGAVGALGYIKDLRTFSHYFMALILIGLVLSNKGFFQNFTAAIAAGPKAPTANTTSSSPSLPAGSAKSMLGAQGQSPGTPGQTGTYGQAKANQYFNAISNFFGGTSAGAAQ